MQEVALDSKIMLIDSPGIVVATGDASDTTVALRNALRIDSLEEAMAPVEVVLKRTGKEYVRTCLHGPPKLYDFPKCFLMLFIP